MLVVLVSTVVMQTTPSSHKSAVTNYKVALAGLDMAWGVKSGPMRWLARLAMLRKIVSHINGLRYEVLELAHGTNDSSNIFSRKIR